MKKLILLVLIFVITPFFIVSEEALVSEVKEIELENIKNSEFIKWEYIKDKVFDENGIIQKGYNKPVKVILGDNATYKDSLIVLDFFKELKVLLPNVVIGFGLEDFGKDSLDLVSLSFRKESIIFNKLLKKQNLPDGNIIGKIPSGLLKNPAFSKITVLNFEFNENISDDSRKMYITWELLKAIFLSPNKSYSFKSEFVVGLFNDMGHDNPPYGSLGHLDKFLLQSLYAPDFKDQFKAYLYEHYPRRYANSFLNKKMTERKAMLIVFGIGLLVFFLMMSVFQNKKFKYSFLNYFLPVLFLLFHLGNLSNIYRYFIVFNSFIGWDESIVFMIITIPPVALVISLLLWVFDTYIVNKNMNFTIQLILKVTFTFIIFNIPLGFMYLLNEDVNIYNTEFQDFYFPMLFVWLGLAFGRGILIYLNHFSESLVKQKDVELSKLKELHAQAETKLLQSQINPHFLYNSLNSIASLAPIDAEKTQKMAYSLSDLFKYSINRKGKKMSTIKDEIDMVKTYLDIEKIRFGNRLQFNIEVDSGIENQEIPLFLIQPLVENAVKHGISQNEGKGEITLKIEKKETELVISVLDSGPNFPEGLVSGHGLQTVYDLLRLTYGETAALNWTNTPEKIISITIPETV